MFAGGVSDTQESNIVDIFKVNDEDGDGYYSDIDCNDHDSITYPGAPELCDGKDNDCDGTVPAEEVDGDGDGVSKCDGDCNDGDAFVNPSAYEIPGDNVDDNCDGSLGDCDPNGCWKNHGQFVRCVAHETDLLMDFGLLTQEEGDELISSAAKSDVGRDKCTPIECPSCGEEIPDTATTCPVCGKTLTVGVMSRVESLASLDAEVETEKDEFGVRWVKDKEGKRPPYIMMVPLLEILSESLQVGVASQKVHGVYEQLISAFGTEYNTLLKTPVVEIEKIVGEKVAEGIDKVRAGNIVIEPGYDGVFGKVAIWKEKESK